MCALRKNLEKTGARVKSYRKPNFSFYLPTNKAPLLIEPDYNNNNNNNIVNNNNNEINSIVNNNNNNNNNNINDDVYNYTATFVTTLR
jgi:hypothetical protein